MCTFNCRWTNTSRHTNSYSLCCIQTIDFKTNVGLHTCNPLHDCHIYNICKMKLRHTKFGIVVISATRQSRAHTHTHTPTLERLSTVRVPFDPLHYWLICDRRECDHEVFLIGDVATPALRENGIDRWISSPGTVRSSCHFWFSGITFVRSAESTSPPPPQRKHQHVLSVDLDQQFRLGSQILRMASS